MAAREMGTVSLGDALTLALLIAEQAPQKWPQAADRWHARFVLAAKGIGVEDSAPCPSSRQGAREGRC